MSLIVVLSRPHLKQNKETKGRNYARQSTEACPPEGAVALLVPKNLTFAARPHALAGALRRQYE